MFSEVTVTTDKNGNLITVSPNNPDYAWFFVQQEGTIMENGWLRKVVKKARIIGKQDEILELGLEEGDVLPGKIVTTESLTPFSSKDSDRDLKIAGNTGIVCRVDDQPIYRKTMYTVDENATDTFIQHTNSEEIRQVQSAIASIRKTSVVTL